VIKKSIALAAISFAAASPITAQLHPLDMIFNEFPSGPVQTDSYWTRDVELMDLNGDGHLDLFAANLDQDNNLYWGDGKGNFTRHLTGVIVNDGGNSRGLACGDIDGDGDVDLFVANSLNQKNYLYENLGGNPPTFLKRTDGPVPNDIANSRQAKFIDIDADGDLDLFVTNFNYTENFLYTNQGGLQGGTEGRFVRVTSGDAVTDQGSSYGIAFGDVDGDGDPDLFVSNHSDDPNSSGELNWLYYNDGVGNFTRSLVGLQSVDVKNSLACDLVDMDNDGDVDLFVGNGTAQLNQVLLNNGSGVFDTRPQSDITIDRGKSIGSAWADVDSDGDLDVILANRSPAFSSELYINTGNGEFQRQRFGPLADNTIDTYDIAIGDIDEDGRPDLALANLGAGNDVLVNNGRQWENLGQFLAGGFGIPTLRSTGNFLPNEKVKFAVSGVPDDGRVFLLVGAAFSNTSFLGGTLVLDQAGIARVFTAGNTGTDNTVTFTANIPAGGLPSAVRLGFQAWIQDPAAPAGYSATNGLRATTP